MAEKQEEKIEKNRHERRKEASDKKRENKRLKKIGMEWVLGANGEWCLCNKSDILYIK